MKLNVNDVVYIPNALDEVRTKCKEHPCGWSDRMDAVLGKTGTILSCEDDEYTVEFKRLCTVWSFPKEALEFWVSIFDEYYIPANATTLHENDNPIIRRIKLLNNKWATKQIAKGKKGEFYDKMLCV